ncbi:hypothetical protein PsWM33_05253 [Pseudovibrio sp. WM33]|nr:hypothetical protein PsWM33_05253 [Pseudovibrio sp. WM33]
MEPATTVIRDLGGLGATSRILETGVHTIKRWRNPVEKGGTNGAIPRKYIFPILVHCAVHDIPHTVETVALTPEQRQFLVDLRTEVCCEIVAPSSPNENTNWGVENEA